MKNVLKLFGFIALVAVIGFSMAACPGVDDDDGGGGGDGSLGNTLTITNAQVYEWDDVTHKYVNFTDTIPDLNYFRSYSYDDDDYVYIPLSDLIEGNPSVTLRNGKLNITLGKPKASSLQDIGDMPPPGITVSTPNVKGFSIVSSFANRDDDFVMYGNFDSDLQDSVIYMYVDKAVNITGQYTDTDYGVTYTYNYAMYLKAGWNSVIMTHNQTGAYSYQSTIKTGTPTTDYRWVINPTPSGGAAPGDFDRD